MKALFDRLNQIVLLELKRQREEDYVYHFKTVAMSLAIISTLLIWNNDVMVRK